MEKLKVPVADEVMVYQWSFHKACKGLGCPECITGAVKILIPLNSLKPDARRGYEESQADIIKAQRERLSLVKEVPSAQMPV